MEDIQELRDEDGKLRRRMGVGPPPTDRVRTTVLHKPGSTHGRPAHGSLTRTLRQPVTSRGTCQFLLPPPMDSEGKSRFVQCTQCGHKHESVEVYGCAVHRECTRERPSRPLHWCGNCPNWQPAETVESKLERRRVALTAAPQISQSPTSETSVQPSPQEIQARNRRQELNKVKWAYGMTTVLSRKDTHLPRTLTSLKLAGFDRPKLFIDGCTFQQAAALEEKLGLAVEVRRENIRTYGNWVLAMAELYIRNPDADRYAIFQDDLVTCLGLREYLESSPWPEEKCYLNLYTFPSNYQLAPRDKRHGWYPSNQLGKGAVALVFDNAGVLALLGSQHMIERPKDPRRGWKSVDGGVVTALKKAGYKEMVHNPSLVQHTGLTSSMGNRSHPLANSFPGEGFHLAQLLG